MHLWSTNSNSSTIHDTMHHIIPYPIPYTIPSKTPGTRYHIPYNYTLIIPYISLTCGRFFCNTRAEPAGCCPNRSDQPPPTSSGKLATTTRSACYLRAWKTIKRERLQAGIHRPILRTDSYNQNTRTHAPSC